VLLIASHCAAFPSFPAEQRKVFRRPPPGVIKIILSTNLAETSSECGCEVLRARLPPTHITPSLLPSRAPVTIDDVVYVIDAGRVREKAYDAYTGAARSPSLSCCCRCSLSCC